MPDQPLDAEKGQKITGIFLAKKMRPQGGGKFSPKVCWVWAHLTSLTQDPKKKAAQDLQARGLMERAEQIRKQVFSQEQR